MTSNMTQTRLTNEMKVLNAERESFYQVVQSPDDMFKFYFMMRGDNESDYNGGHYIGRIELPADYPKNPGNFFMLTPSGRFKIGSKICLTNSGYHKESWSPMWNLKNMVIAFSSVFLDDSTSGISHIKDSSANRKRMATESCDYNLKNHPEIAKLFTQFVTPEGKFRTYKEVDEYVARIIKEEADRKIAERDAKKAKREAKRAKKAAKRAAKKAKKEAKRKGLTEDNADESATEEKEVNEEQLEGELNELEKELEGSDNVEVEAKTEADTTYNDKKNAADTVAEKSVEEDVEEDVEEEIDEVEEVKSEIVEEDAESEGESEVESEIESEVEPKAELKPEAKPKTKTQIRVKRKQRVYPRNREEWFAVIDAMTIETHDPKILAMNF